jgi:hypothetical protein
MLLSRKRPLMTNTVFYSWQSDTHAQHNRFFIKDALERAIRRMGQSFDLEEVLRLDQDTQAVPGNPEIANTILAKIAACGIFVPGLPFVAQTAAGKYVPNPNVMFELGHAMSTVGSARIIAVMNEAYGPAAAGLPFDLAHRRWPIRYTLAPDASVDVRRQVRETLVAALAQAMGTIVASGVLAGGQGQRPSLDLSLHSIHEDRLDVISSDGWHDRLPARSASYTFLVENTGVVPVAGITVGMVAWSLSTGEAPAPLSRALQSYLQVVPVRGHYAPYLSLRWRMGQDDSRLDPFQQVGIRKVGPYYFPGYLVSAKVSCAVYLQSQDTQPTWFQLDFAYTPGDMLTVHLPSPSPPTLTPKGIGLPQVSWEEVR